jgi:hypothetical protein
MDDLRSEVTQARPHPHAGDRPRILIVSYHFDNLNPTVRLWPFIFVECADVTFFGPGHAASDDSALAAFIRRNGPFDVIVLDDHVFVNSLPGRDYEGTARNYRQFYVHRISPMDAVLAARRLFDTALNANVPVLVSQFENDSYNLRQSHFDRLRDSGVYAIGWGSELYPWLGEVEMTGEGVWIQRANDRWKTFVVDHQNRVISMPAMLDFDEFCFRPLKLRRDEWSVPGTRYRSRAIARRELKAMGKRLGGGAHYVFMKALSGLGLPLYRQRALLDLYNGGFVRTLQESQLVYTCGSAMKMALRKFFEIPAAGAVLVCDPCYGFEALGFRDGEHAILCQPEQLAERFAAKQNLEALQEIATAGQRMVLRTHSISARARQMRRCVDAIVAGRFRGSYWEKGEFKLRGDEHA